MLFFQTVKVFEELQSVEFYEVFNFQCIWQMIPGSKRRHSIHSLICSNIRRWWLVLFVVLSRSGHTRLSTCSWLQVPMCSQVSQKSSNWSAACCSFLGSDKKSSRSEILVFCSSSSCCPWNVLKYFVALTYCIYILHTYVREFGSNYVWQFDWRLFFVHFFKCFYTDT